MGLCCTSQSLLQVLIKALLVYAVVVYKMVAVDTYRLVFVVVFADLKNSLLDLAFWQGVF